VIGQHETESAEPDSCFLHCDAHGLVATRVRDSLLRPWTVWLKALEKERPTGPPSVGAPTLAPRPDSSCWVCFFPSLLKPHVPILAFPPSSLLFVHLRSPHDVSVDRRILPLSPHFYLRFSHHSHSLAIAIRSLFWNPFIPSGSHSPYFLPWSITFSAPHELSA
jgi:hypothetical protein